MAQRPAKSTLFPYNDALPISILNHGHVFGPVGHTHSRFLAHVARSEEHTSELQSRGHLVCRLLPEKKKRPVASYNRTTTQPQAPSPSLSISRHGGAGAPAVRG